jgi:hypothetical protein
MECAKKDALNNAVAALKKSIDELRKTINYPEDPIPLTITYSNNDRDIRSVLYPMQQLVKTAIYAFECHVTACPECNDDPNQCYISATGF